MKNYSALNPRVPCSALIFQSDNHLVSTYCMRERGHEGEHSIVNAAPVEVKHDEAA